MTNYLSIGQMSKLYNISIQTLRHYDRIDLFKPAYTDPNSNYRYYSPDQFIYLEIIKYLKYIGTPLDEIRHIINFQNSIEDLASVLTEKEKTIDKQIQQLINLKQLIREKISQLEQTSSIGTLGEVYVKHYDEVDAVVFEINDSDKDDFILSIRKLISQIEVKYHYLPDCNLIFLADYVEYLESKTINYSKMYLALDSETEDPVKYGTHAKIPAGDYLCILFRGLDNDAAESYRTLSDYIKKNKLEVSGYFYESPLINGFATTNEGDYIIEIRILLKQS
jgi:DNA-binding transcriptional MerR regulator